MKLTNELVRRFGTDKLLHASFAGWAVALASMFGIVLMIVITILTMVLSVVKERRFDSSPEKKDTIAAVVGIGASWLMHLLSYLF